MLPPTTGGRGRSSRMGGRWSSAAHRTLTSRTACRTLRVQRASPGRTPLGDRRFQRGSPLQCVRWRRWSRTSWHRRSSRWRVLPRSSVGAIDDRETPSKYESVPLRW